MCFNIYPPNLIIPQSSGYQQQEYGHENDNSKIQGGGGAVLMYNTGSSYLQENDSNDKEQSCLKTTIQTGAQNVSTNAGSKLSN